jgi:hypothetical protein
MASSMQKAKSITTTYCIRSCKRKPQKLSRTLNPLSGASMRRIALALSIILLATICAGASLMQASAAKPTVWECARAVIELDQKEHILDVLWREPGSGFLAKNVGAFDAHFGVTRTPEQQELAELEIAGTVGMRGWELAGIRTDTWNGVKSIDLFFKRPKQ